MQRSRYANLNLERIGDLENENVFIKWIEKYVDENHTKLNCSAETQALSIKTYATIKVLLKQETK